MHKINNDFDDLNEWFRGTKISSTNFVFLSFPLNVYLLRTSFFCLFGVPCKTKLSEIIFIFLQFPSIFQWNLNKNRIFNKSKGMLNNRNNFIATSRFFGCKCSVNKIIISIKIAPSHVFFITWLSGNSICCLTASHSTKHYKKLQSILFVCTMEALIKKTFQENCLTQEN